MKRLPAGVDPGANAAMLPLAICALLLVAIHATYLVSASLGHVDWCFPYIEGCSTISRASRKEPEVFIYRLLITSSAILMIPYWRTTAILHGVLGAGQHGALRRTFVVLGTAAAIGLAINASVLGSELELARTLRRVCVIGFFFFVYIAAALSTLSLWRLSAGSATLRGPLRWKIAILALMLAIGIFHYGVMPFVEALQPYEDELQNATEWIWVALLGIFFGCSFSVWRGARLSPNWTASA